MAGWSKTGRTTTMVAMLEAVAQRIGPTVDSTYEALLLFFYRAMAERYACELSEFAAAVFRVSQDACPLI